MCTEILLSRKLDYIRWKANLIGHTLAALLYTPVLENSESVYAIAIANYFAVLACSTVGGNGNHSFEENPILSQE